MNLLLINPPYPVCESLTMPLGLLYVAAGLEEAGHTVVLEDLQLSRSPIRRVKQALTRFHPQIVGITSFSSNLAVASGILKAVKRLGPEIITVWGGPHVSFDDEAVLRDHPWVDAVVRGEGEETLVELTDSVIHEKGFGGVQGLSWREPERGIRRNPPRPFRKDLDGWPKPAWHLLPLAQYRAFKDGASVLTSRGCPHRCLFCVGRKMIGGQGRFRSAGVVVDEMAALVGLGFPRIRIEDDLFTFRRERALAICREIVRRSLKVRWRAYARVDTVDPELLNWMGRAGCERVLFGAESGSPEILRRIRKGITPEQTRKAVEMCRTAGIGVLASFVLGLPGETPQTLRQTLDFARSLKVPYTLNLLTPYVGTEIREEAGRWGIRILSDDWRLYDQGKPLTTTPTLRRWHLARAVGEYRRELQGYLGALLAQEHNRSQRQEHAGELEHYRRRRFLRKLIGEEILERHGDHLAAAGGKGIEGLARGLVPYMGMEVKEMKNHLQPLIEGKILRLVSGPRHSEWTWAT